jgi:CubicO group peptidase (beta-lactamase class C family)
MRSIFVSSRRLIAMSAIAIAAPALAQSPANPKFDALVALAEAKMKEFGVPGLALGVIENGAVTIRGIGVTNVEDPLPVNAHTVFPIASISKTFAATAMMRLVEQGKVDLKAPVRTYIPEFRVRDEAVSRDVTVWHLLTHLGGWEGQVSGPDRGSETLANFVTIQTDLMQVAPPGAAWSYNNAGFSYAGRVIEKVNNSSINIAVREPLCGGAWRPRWRAGSAATLHSVSERHRRRRRPLHDRHDDLRAISHGRRHRRER